MRKNLSVIFVLLSCILLVGCFSGFSKYNALAATNDITTESKAAYLIEPTSKSVIVSINEKERMPIASMCKIMTLLLCFESIDKGEISLTDNITVSKTASGMGGSQIFLEEGAQYPVFELIKGIVVASANDACVAMAERICGSEDNFISLMNEKAKQLQMNNTVFTNCTGLPKPGQYSCAEDVAKMFCELIKHNEYFKFSRIWTDKICHPNDRITEISNTNKLIRFYDGCEGGKTGYTSESGHCLSACASRNGMRLVSVVINAPNSKSRFKDVSSMFNYGFANYEVKKIIDQNSPLEIVANVKGGKKQTIELIADKSFNLFSKKGQKRSIEYQFVPLKNLIAPINKGQVVGKINLFENGVLICDIDALANEDVLEKTYFDNIVNVIENWTI